MIGPFLRFRSGLSSAIRRVVRSRWLHYSADGWVLGENVPGIIKWHEKCECDRSEVDSKCNIRARIDAPMAEQSRRTAVSADRVVREFARIGFVNATDVINMDEATIRNDAVCDDIAAIASVRVKVIPGEDGDGTEREVKLADKTKALEFLGRQLGMFNDKLSVGVEGAVQIIDDLKKPE